MPAGKRRRNVSTADILRQATELAHAKHSLPCPPEERKGLPLLPVSVTVEVPRIDAEIREHVLYKLGDPAWEPQPAAKRLAWGIGLPEDMSVAEEFAKATNPYKKFSLAAKDGLPPPTTNTRVRLPVYVKRGNQVLRDELDIHIGSLGGLGSAMAAAVQSYATQVCRDLGLNSSWFNSLLRHMGQLFQEVNEDIKLTGTSELLVTTDEDGQLRPKPSDLPRIEEVTPELEAMEKERANRRKEKEVARRRQKEEQQQQALPPGPD